jgi:hypothetical protein
MRMVEISGGQGQSERFFERFWRAKNGTVLGLLAGARETALAVLS